MQVLAADRPARENETDGNRGGFQGDSDLSANASYGLQQELRGHSRPPQPRWGLWSTLLWVGGIYLVTTAVQGFLGFQFVLWWQNAHPDQPVSLAALQSHGPLFGTVTVLSAPVLLGLTFIAIKLSGVPVREYLALRSPTLRQFVFSLLFFVILLPILDQITVQSGREPIPDFMTGTYASARDAGPVFLTMFALALTVAAPLTEEILFRGFFYRGIAMRLGPAFAILMTSLIWASLHVQYDLFFMVQVFAFGVILGILRWRSDSLYLVIGLHAILNALAFAQTVLATPVTV